MSSEELIMNIQPKVIDHLGINMYTSMPAVISELIANSWDAGSSKVEIIAPDINITKDYNIIVRDNGEGMSFDEINNLYLLIGRNRREDTHTKKGPKNRKVLGRKGIGKLSVFGVARTIVVRSIKNHILNEFKMDIDKIKAVKVGMYKPEIITKNKKVAQNKGVTIILGNLKRKNRINVQELREGIAGRFRLIGKGFSVLLNKKPITKKDRNIKDIEYTFPINEVISQKHPDWRVKGTVWTRTGTIREEYNRGVALFARGKLIQEPTFFGATSGKEYAYPHMFGELHADFLDEKNDIISTNRSSINWESEEGQEIREWGKKLLTGISMKWAEGRIKKRADIVVNMPELSKWLSGLSPTEKSRAMKILTEIAKNENLPEQKIVDLAVFVRDSFKYRAFQELAEKIEKSSDGNAALLVDLFKEWGHLEAKEMYRIMQGRIAAIQTLEKYIETNAKEVPTLHNYIRNFPWILDARWTIVEDEVTYSKLLRKQFPETDKIEKDRRIDFLCFGVWPSLIVIELKRPGYAIGKKDLDQLREYVVFLEKQKGSDPNLSNRNVYGYLICEKMQKSYDLQVIIKQLSKNDMFVRKYSELLANAVKIHKEFIQKYEELTDQTLFS